MSIQGKKIHYVIAAYFGPRRAEYKPQIEDRGLFLRWHLRSLAALKHSIDRITIVVHYDGVPGFPAGGDLDPAIAELVRDVLKIRVLDPDDVHVIFRPNDYGLSYTALAHVTTMAGPQSFDYTIFNEDDYVFTIDNFDRYLVHKLERAPHASYLCGCERLFHPDGKSHAAVCTGIAKASMLADLPTSYPRSLIPQVAWSRELMKHGPIIDWLEDYATGYRLDDDSVRWIERHHAGTGDPFVLPPLFRQALLVPVQAIDATQRGVVNHVHFWRDVFVRRQAQVTTTGEIIWKEAP